MGRRNEILKSNEAIRRGNARKPTRLPDGEVAFRIPEEDWKVLMTLFPMLRHPDGKTRHQAWKDFRSNPVAEKYLVVRTPSQVHANNKRIIVR